MRIAGLILVSMFSALAFAKTTVRHPIMIEGDKGTFPIASINKYLTQEKRFPEYFDVTSNDDAEKADQRFGEISQRFDEEMKTWGKKYENLSLTLGVIPGAVDTAKYQTCYKGDISGVVDTAQTLVSLQFTEQFTVYAWRYGKKKHTEYEETNPEYENAYPKEWKNYNTNSDSVMMLGSYSDDGTDTNVVVISPCK